MTRARTLRLLILAVCAAVFVAGGVLVYIALRGTPPEATPMPDREFSLSLQEALDSDPVAANTPIAIPTGTDLGPYVNTRPVTVPSREDDRTDGDDDAATSAASNPTSHLYIPSIFVSAPVVPQGVTSSNEMALPQDLRQVGLLDTTSALEATEGSTLIAGHVTAGGYHGALYFLGRVQPGAAITTVDADGEPTEWVVTSVRNYRKTSLPAEIFETTGQRILTLVTCGGPIIQTPDGRWTHEDNIVVTAAPVPTE